MPPRPLRTPPTRDFPTIRRALVFYKVFAYATGVALVLLCVEILFKYPLGLELELFGSQGVAAFVPTHSVEAFNASSAVQFVHGYLYMAYLIADFVLVTVMRYPITRFLVIAAGGVIPFLSFFTERKIHHEVEGYLREREAAAGRRPTAAATPAG